MISEFLQYISSQNKPIRKKMQHNNAARSLLSSVYYLINCSEK